MRSLEVVQQMIEWIETNMEEGPSLQKVSAAVGYSPWYCSEMFHEITGFTMKSYITGRRLARIMEEIRDTDERILDIAVKYGFSSQEALTRVFKEQYGCTPAAYRKNNKPVPMTVHKHVLFPKYDEKRIKTMEKEKLGVRVEHIPAHKYLGIWEERAFNFDPAERGYAWNEEECQIYQRHYPEKLGYQVVRPVKRL